MNATKTEMNDVRERELTPAELETVAGGDPTTGAAMPTAATAAVLGVSPLAASGGWCGGLLEHCRELTGLLCLADCKSATEQLFQTHSSRRHERARRAEGAGGPAAVRPWS